MLSSNHWLPCSRFLASVGAHCSCSFHAQSWRSNRLRHLPVSTASSLSAALYIASICIWFDMSLYTASTSDIFPCGCCVHIPLCPDSAIFIWGRKNPLKAGTKCLHRLCQNWNHFMHPLEVHIIINLARMSLCCIVVTASLAKDLAKSKIFFCSTLGNFRLCLQAHRDNAKCNSMFYGPFLHQEWLSAFLLAPSSSVIIPLGDQT